MRAMKIKILLLVVSVVMAGIFVVYSGTRNSELSDLMLENVEALAAGEYKLPYHCYGSGSIYCHKINLYVYTMVGGYSLE